MYEFAVDCTLARSPFRVRLGVAGVFGRALRFVCIVDGHVSFVLLCFLTGKKWRKEQLELSDCFSLSLLILFRVEPIEFKEA